MNSEPTEIDEHVPVMLGEVLDYLKIKAGGVYLDCTLGSGGHTREILKLGGHVIGIDQDANSLARTKKSLHQFVSEDQPASVLGKNLSSASEENDKGKLFLLTGNFADLLKLLNSTGIKKVDGILYDLGYSSDQMSDPSYGLSFMKDCPLDMRLDKSLNVSASDLINALSEKELSEMFWKYGEDRMSRQVAKAIVLAKKNGIRFSSTKQLADLIVSVKRKNNHFSKKTYKKIHPATRIFQALRIAVNDELVNLQTSLPQAVSLLKPEARLAVISFHSGEDRIVKNFMKGNPDLNVLTTKPIIPGDLELRNNPRSRSAKLRVASKRLV